MFDRFSDHSRLILTQVSKKIAFDLKSKEVRPEHVLLAIDEDEKSVGARIIGQTVPEGEIRKEVEKLSEGGTNGDFKESDIRFSMAVEKLLDVAAGEADSMGDSTIGTEHLLLGMLKEPSGNAKEILGRLGIVYEPVRAFLEKTANSTTKGAQGPQKKVRVREHFAIVYFDAACSDQELQLTVIAIERLKGVAMTHVMKLKPEDANPPDEAKPAGEDPKILLPGEF